MQSDWKFVHGRYFWRVKYTQKDVVEFSTFSIIPDLPSRPAIYMSMCHPLVIPTWFSLLGFTWNSIPGEARCGVFLRNRVTHRDHLPLDIFGGWHLSISPIFAFIWTHFLDFPSSLGCEPNRSCLVKTEKRPKSGKLGYGTW